MTGDGLVSSRLKSKLKFGEIVEKGGDETGVQAERPSSSVSTFERLQDEIIELEADKKRLRRSLDLLRAEERSVARRLDLTRDRRPRDTGTATASLTTVIQYNTVQRKYVKRRL